MSDLGATYWVVQYPDGTLKTGWQSRRMPALYGTYGRAKSESKNIRYWEKQAGIDNKVIPVKIVPLSDLPVISLIP